MRRIHRSATLVGCVAFAAVVLQPSIASADVGNEEPTAAAPAKAKAKRRQEPTHASTSTSDRREHGNASFYSKRLTGRKTASGDAYDPNALTAAHRTLPLGTKVRVTNPKNDKSVVVTVNDRGPVPKGRVLDVSSAAADALGMKKDGVTKVETRVVGEPDGKRDAADGSTSTR